MSEHEEVLASASITVTREQLDLISRNLDLFTALVNQRFVELIQEQSKTNGLLLGLVEALAAESADPETPPLRDLAGRLIR